jgi:hypothetical protein
LKARFAASRSSLTIDRTKSARPAGTNFGHLVNAAGSSLDKHFSRVFMSSALAAGARFRTSRPIAGAAYYAFLEVFTMLPLPLAQM